MINYQFSGDYAPFHLGGLHGSRREQKGHKSNVEGLSCVSQKFPLNILNISNFKIQIGKSIKCTVDPESKKATVRVPDQYKRGRALNKRYIWYMYCVRKRSSNLAFLSHITIQLCMQFQIFYAEVQRPLKLLAHGFQDTAKEEKTYFVPGRFWRW